MSKLENIVNLYPHNKKVFKELLENLKTNDSVAIVQATGTGKGKLASCIVEYTLFKNQNAKILIFAPLNSILQNYKENFNLANENVIYLTYKSLESLSDNDLLNIGLNFDIVILDEFHRLGAPIWNEKMNKILFNKKQGSKIIGMTATPIRYLDNEKDMVKELFNGNVINGITLKEAIIDGILPGFEYNICYYKPEDKINEIKGKIQKNNNFKDNDKEEIINRVDKIIFEIENNKQIRKIIKNRTKDIGKNQKWVIFCKDKENLNEIKECCINWFIGKPNIYIIHSGLGKKYNSEILATFRSLKTGINVLLCVDMLNEGVHIRDLNGVIMLRKTESPIIFLQQLGRSIEAGKDFKPIIFDLVGNVNGLKTLNVIENLKQNVNNLCNSYDEKCDNDRYIIVNNYLEELDKILDELSLYVYNNMWTYEEDEILRNNYSSKGIDYCCKLLPHRTSYSIQKRANIIGLHIDKNEWSNEEDAFLINNYELKGGRFCKEKLAKRTLPAIHRRARILGLKVSNYGWSEEEEKFLIDNYETKGLSFCIENLTNKSRDSIQSKAKRLGLKVELQIAESWSKKEDKILIENYSKYGAEYCHKKLPHRSLEAVKSRVKVLKLNLDSWWSKEEEDFLRENYPKYGSKYCQEHLPNRKLSSIKAKATSLKLNVEGRGWTKEEDDFLRENFPKYGNKYCIDKLNYKTENAVRSRIKYLKLKSEVGNWSKDEINFLIENYELHGPKYCSIHLKNRKYETVVSKANSLGLKYKRK